MTCCARVKTPTVRDGQAATINDVKPHYQELENSSIIIIFNYVLLFYTYIYVCVYRFSSRQLFNGLDKNNNYLKV